MMNFHMPVELFTGENCIEKNRARIAEFGSRCLIVTGASSAKKSGALDDVTEALDALGIRHAIFDGIRENPSLTSCMEAGKAAHDFGAEFIFGVGGGSPMDAAKSVAVFASNPTLDEDAFYAKKWDKKPLPILLAGTTAGTGSEVTDVSVVTDSKSRKHSIHDPLIYAAVSFGDPRWLRSMPASSALSAGVDVIAHCMESYFSRKANTISRGMAVTGIRRIFAPLRKLADGRTLDTNNFTALYEASILGGLAICVTGTVFPHNVGYFLTESRGLPHGAACAVFLPALMDHMASEDPELCKRFYEELGFPAAAVRQLILDTLPPLDLKLTAEEIDAALPRWENNGTVKNTPGTITLEYIRGLLLPLIG